MHKYVIKIPPNGLIYEMNQKALDKHMASGEIPPNAVGRRSDSSEYLAIPEMLAWSAAHPQDSTTIPETLASSAAPPQDGAFGAHMVDSQSVVSRLGVISGFIKIAYAVAGLIICAALGAGLLLGKDFMAEGAIIGGFVGGMVGYLLGSLMVVFVDWAAAVLLLQEKIYRAVSQSQKTG